MRQRAPRAEPIDTHTFSTGTLCKISIQASKTFHVSERDPAEIHEIPIGMQLALPNRMRAFSMVLFSPFISLLIGCASLHGAAREQAANDLQCPEAQISTYQAPGGRIVARGCGAWAEYECIQTGTEPRCTPTNMPPQKNSFGP